MFVGYFLDFGGLLEVDGDIFLRNYLQLLGKFHLIVIVGFSKGWTQVENLLY